MRISLITFTLGLVAVSNDAGIEFLASNGLKSDVVKLASGLQYKIIESGDGKEHPLRDTDCTCHYEGRYANGDRNWGLLAAITRADARVCCAGPPKSTRNSLLAKSSTRPSTEVNLRILHRAKLSLVGRRRCSSWLRAINGSYISRASWDMVRTAPRPTLAAATCWCSHSTCSKSMARQSLRCGVVAWAGAEVRREAARAHAVANAILQQEARKNSKYSRSRIGIPKLPGMLVPPVLNAERRRLERSTPAGEGADSREPKCHQIYGPHGDEGLSVRDGAQGRLVDGLAERCVDCGVGICFNL